MRWANHMTHFGGCVMRLLTFRTNTSIPMPCGALNIFWRAFWLIQVIMKAR